MKIFGIHFTTKKELRKQNADLMLELEDLLDDYACVCEEFPFDIGQVVYDVALKNAKGRYTKTKPSLEHSTITEVVVDEKNYFNLVKRLKRNDVFLEREEAEDFLADICSDVAVTLTGASDEPGC